MVLPESWGLLLLGAVLVATVALTAFRLGRYRNNARGRGRPTDHEEIDRASSLVDDLESVVGRLRKTIVNHGRAVRRFSTRLARYDRRRAVSRHELCDRAEEMLKPASRLAGDISRAYGELVQQMTHLSALADLRTDPLTDAANRRAVDELLSAQLAERTRQSAGLSLAVVDIDFFKQFNDAHGRMQGDRVLRELAELLRATIREQDVLGRYGGEEFIVIMPHTEPYVAAELAERIRRLVSDKLSLTVSIGLAVSAHGDAPATLLGRSDAALALAKGAGRNCVYVHDESMERIVGINDHPAGKSSPGNGKAPLASKAAGPPSTRAAACESADTAASRSKPRPEELAPLACAASE
jgi:diguanylate cyclase (GGDEF)-like protein